jgi:hypothetical protein
MKLRWVSGYIWIDSHSSLTWNKDSLGWLALKFFKFHCSDVKTWGCSRVARMGSLIGSFTYQPWQTSGSGSGTISNIRTLGYLRDHGPYQNLKNRWRLEHVHHVINASLVRVLWDTHIPNIPISRVVLVTKKMRITDLWIHLDHAWNSPRSSDPSEYW